MTAGQRFCDHYDCAVTQCHVPECTICDGRDAICDMRWSVFDFLNLALCVVALVFVVSLLFFKYTVSFDAYRITVDNMTPANAIGQAILNFIKR